MGHMHLNQRTRGGVCGAMEQSVSPPSPTSCYFPLRMPDGSNGGAFYDPIAGILYVNGRPLFADGSQSLLTADDEQAVLAALCASAMKRARWGNINLPDMPCPTTGEHALFVGRRAAQLARALGLAESDVADAFQEGSAHDLHEELPGVGDVLAPVLRHLYKHDPTVALIHENARVIIRALCHLPRLIDLPPFIERIVKAADRDAAALERAIYFEGAERLPVWLHPRSREVVRASWCDLGYSPSAGQSIGDFRRIELERVYSPNQRDKAGWTLRRAVQPCGTGYAWALAGLDKLKAGTVPEVEDVPRDTLAHMGWTPLSQLRHEVFDEPLPPLPPAEPRSEGSEETSVF
jgi:hypothetical protein